MTKSAMDPSDFNKMYSEVNKLYGSKLKPCPFCGGEAEINFTNDNKHKPYVRCKYGVFTKRHCPLGRRVKHWNYNTVDEAVEAHNKRYNQIKELEEKDKIVGLKGRYYDTDTICDN